MREWLVGVCAMCGACSLFTNLDGLSNPDTFDASHVDGGVAGDAKASDANTGEASSMGDPGVVDCPPYGGCTGGEICCSNFGCIATSSEGTCLEQDGGVFLCDEAADCPGADASCCYTYSSTDSRLGSLCRTRAGVACSIFPTEVWTCKSDDDCAVALVKCVSHSCFGVTIRTCGGACPT